MNSCLSSVAQSMPDSGFGSVTVTILSGRVVLAMPDMPARQGSRTFVPHLFRGRSRYVTTEPAEGGNQGRVEMPSFMEALLVTRERSEAQQKVSARSARATRPGSSAS